MRKTILAALIALSIPCAVQAQTAKEYQEYQVSCETEAACQDFNVTFEETDDRVAQTRRTRSRRSRSSSIEPFQNWYLGTGAGIFFADNADLGFQAHVFAGTKFNPYIATDAEFLIGFAGLENTDENVTIIGFYLNPRFQYKFPRSNITGFFSPGFGFSRFSAFDDSDTEFDFQFKIGASFEVNEKLDAFAQGRYQNEAESFGFEGGVIFDL